MKDARYSLLIKFCSIRDFCNPTNNATSLPGIGCKYKEDISEPPVSKDLMGNAGEANLTKPISIWGLIIITLPPLARNWINSFINRG